ncbi:cbb3-type cytochrome c oxidase subunit I, partial [Streptomyces nigra]
MLRSCPAPAGSSHPPPVILVAPAECDARAPRGHRRGVKRIRDIRGVRAVRWLTTTDHKTIGTLYLVTSFVFFVIGGVMALVMRAELARPGLQIMSNEQFNQAFTMHGTIMLLMFATPLFA